MAQAPAGPADQSWLSIAASPPVVRRGLLYAVVVGAILITINHGDVVLSGAVTGGRLAKMGLTVTVPFIVSTLSSVGALRTAAGRRPAPSGADAPATNL